jgi:hypothetical protein
VLKIVKVIGITALTVITFVVGACVIKVHHYNVAFSQVSVGDSEASVVARLGDPSFREHRCSDRRSAFCR